MKQKVNLVKTRAGKGGTWDRRRLGSQFLAWNRKKIRGYLQLFAIICDYLRPSWFTA